MGEGAPGARLALSTDVVTLSAAGAACSQTATLESCHTHRRRADSQP